MVQAKEPQPVLLHCTCSSSSILPVSTQLSASTVCSNSELSVSATQTDASNYGDFADAQFIAASQELTHLETQLNEVVAQQTEVVAELHRVLQLDPYTVPLFNIPGAISAFNLIQLFLILFTGFWFIRTMSYETPGSWAYLGGGCELALVLIAIFAKLDGLSVWFIWIPCAIESVLAIFQFNVLTVMIHLSEGNLTVLIKHVVAFDWLFSNVLLDEMSSWFGVSMVVFYFACKFFCFVVIATAACQVSQEIVDKDAKEEKLRAESASLRTIILDVVRQIDALRPSTTAPVAVGSTLQLSATQTETSASCLSLDSTLPSHSFTSARTGRSTSGSIRSGNQYDKNRVY
ncbi:hypothetical protein M3Y98_00653000 [Aphelenchoides besseyi]|nr:hypothetical protein M3Y98_00653000 [Aphelenchoides besseyi]KAI6208698.1 hypothetical protein M3Y96_00142400 [Aphelenchoides besseyi]